jgi:hypothetical protein
MKISSILVSALALVSMLISSPQAAEKLVADYGGLSGFQSTV